MNESRFEVEPFTLFSNSLIWQLNRTYYQNEGINAWSKDVVPHHMTSNSMVGKTYAELILAFLKDLARKKQLDQTVYLIELGAGHGRLAFHIMKHLTRLRRLEPVSLPPFCYVLSDLVESNLAFFEKHPQFQPYFDAGTMDVAFFDATASTTIHTRNSRTEIGVGDLDQPLIVIANYFFDSIPTDLFLLQNKQVSSCSISLTSGQDNRSTGAKPLLEDLEVQYQKMVLDQPFYPDPLFNMLMEEYQGLLFNTHLLFPERGLVCLSNLRKLSNKGLLLLTMDKGFHEIQALENRKEPELVTHGSFSIFVNYHAFAAFCEASGGKAIFSSSSNFYLQLGCLMMLPDADEYLETDSAFQRYVNDFGPDDFNGIKRMTYQQIARLNLKDLMALLRLSAYDSTFFEKILPRLRTLSKHITVPERRRFAEAMHAVWDMYFEINESVNLAFELGGLFYDLGFYQDALTFFKRSSKTFEKKADLFYNLALCYYQLRQDKLFLATLKNGRKHFPEYAKYDHLDTLDLKA